MKQTVGIEETACGKCVLLGNGCPRGYGKGERLTVYADPKEFGIKCDARVVEDKQKMRKFEKETVHDEKSGTKIESLKPVEDSLKNKAKTLQQWMDEVTYVRQGKLLVPESPFQVAQKLVLLSDVQAHLKQKFEDFDVVGFLMKHKISYDEWLKHQFFELIKELEGLLG